MVRRPPTRRPSKKTEPAAGPPLWDPKYELHLSGGALAGMSFVVADWKFPDSPPEVVWLAEVDRQLVGHAQEYLDAVAALVRRGLPGWTPYERARDADGCLAGPIGGVWVPMRNGAGGFWRGGVWPYAWAARMDPNLREPRRLKAVS